MTSVNIIRGEYNKLFNNDKFDKLSIEMDDIDLINFIKDSIIEYDSLSRNMRWVIMINKVKYNNCFSKALYELGMNSLYESDMEYISILEEKFDLFTKVASYNRELLDCFKMGIVSKKETFIINDMISHEVFYNKNYISLKIDSNESSINTGIEHVVNEDFRSRNSIDKFEIFFKEFVASKSESKQLVK